MAGEGRSEMEFTDIETTAESLDPCVVFHVVMDIIGYILYMHQQIPSMLQDINFEFDALHTEYKDLEVTLAQTEMKASLRREQAGRKREVRVGISKFDKLLNVVASLQTALQLAISEIPNIEGIILILGGSSLRPQHVYELCFSQRKIASRTDCDFSKTRAAEVLSRKTIRTLISKGVVSDSYAGPTKLFLLVKAPPSFTQPTHFLPKPEFRYNKKILPFRLRFKCRTQDREMDGPFPSASSNDLLDPLSNDTIWFQCRHVIKGMACRTSPAEE